MTNEAVVEESKPVNPIGNNLPITLHLSLDEINLILVGLGELKHAIVANLDAKIKAQAEEQVLKARAQTIPLMDKLMDRI